MAHKLGNNGMCRKEQFVLLGVDGRGASEKMISELGLGGIKKCYRCEVGGGGGGQSVKAWVVQAEGTAWVKAQKHEHAWHVLK